MKTTSEMRGYSLIVAASILWGTMGILAKFAFKFGIWPDVDCVEAGGEFWDLVGCSDFV